ncbi:hypothetical protein [Arthrobacter sp. StoSoilB13]|uniref:hypothetical protein n=1 Tax=Arthrobacter sp. StoSoilB13 TaxID=2830993 RepID=UPI001CC65E9F|nr:hypothetical protein [Arthrobacter sp. StoSoilB13]BCW47927.1 hypothetical protein StoSoilB13_02690 [Arthrobacter sp. StoSoilB13]
MSTEHDELADLIKSEAHVDWFSGTPEDLAKLHAALDAVEDLCAYWETLAGGDRHYATAVREAIKRGLGEDA